MSAQATDLLVRCIFKREDKFLLLERPKSKGGGYSLVGGHVEARETPRDALIREVKEEIGIRLESQHLRLIKILYRHTDKKRKIHLVFEPSEWSGTPVNKEPKKCKGLTWATQEDLPLLLSPSTLQVLSDPAGFILYEED